MPVQIDEAGNRFVQVEVEVPGTPETVWDAIATGPGVSSWFVPTSIDGREGGDISASFGPGMDSHSVITEWEPGRRFVARQKEVAENQPDLADEWTVEAKSGDTCIVRVVHRWFADGDQWDNQVEQYEGGWPGFFRILRAYLTYFPGQKSKAFQLTGFASGTKEEAWHGLTQKLDLPVTGEVGDAVSVKHDVLELEGSIENAGKGEHEGLLLVKADAPFAGVVHFFAMPMGGQVILSLSFYLYGEDADANAAEWQPKWSAFISENYPMPEGFNPAC